MKWHIVSILLFMFASALGGCGKNTAPGPSSESLTIENQAGLMDALKASNAKVETGDTIAQDFFSPEGSIVNVNGQDIQVFEYENQDAMESEASQVAPDGGSVGTTMMMWMAAPHFYKAGRIIVIYIGSDEQILTLLQSIMGAQFAGR